MFYIVGISHYIEHCLMSIREAWNRHGKFLTIVQIISWIMYAKDANNVEETENQDTANYFNTSILIF